MPILKIYELQHDINKDYQITERACVLADSLTGRNKQYIDLK